MYVAWLSFTIEYQVKRYLSSGGQLLLSIKCHDTCHLVVSYNWVSIVEMSFALLLLLLLIPSYSNGEETPAGAHPESQNTHRHVHVGSLTASAGPYNRLRPLLKFMQSCGRSQGSHNNVISLLSRPGAIAWSDFMTCSTVSGAPRCSAGAMTWVYQVGQG